MKDGCIAKMSARETVHSYKLWICNLDLTWIKIEDKWRFSSVSETVILQAKQQAVKWNLIVQPKNIIVHRQLPENISVHFLICRSIEYWTKSLLNYISESETLVWNIIISTLIINQLDFNHQSTLFIKQL